MTHLSHALTRSSEVGAAGWRHPPPIEVRIRGRPTDAVRQVRRAAYPEVADGAVPELDEYDRLGVSAQIELVEGGHTIFCARLTPVLDGAGPLDRWLTLDPRMKNALTPARGDLTRFAAAAEAQGKGLLRPIIKEAIEAGLQLGLTRFAWLLEEGAHHRSTFISTGARTIAEGLGVKGTTKTMSLHLLDLRRSPHKVTFERNFGALRTALPALN